MTQVSVVIPVYNVEKYIAATVQSVLNQTYTDFELLIVDDGSPDRSVEICQQFHDSRIRIVRQQNQGVAAARNAGIRQAKGGLLALLDGDDLWLPEKLTKHVEHLERSPNIGVSFSRSAFIDQAGEPLGIYQLSKLKDITPLDLLIRTPIGNGSAAVFRRDVFEAIKFEDSASVATEPTYFDEDRQLHPSEDVECWLRIALLTPWTIEGLAEPLTLYRVNSEGHSAQLTKKLSSWNHLLTKIKTYTPEALMAQLERPARAYQLRHLARRAVTLKAGTTAIRLIYQALVTYWRILTEEPRRTLLTLLAAVSLWILPEPFYRQLELWALKITGAAQKRRILHEQIEQA